MAFLLRSPTRLYACAGAIVLATPVTRPVQAQHEGFRNTDPGRPMRVEDALAIPRYALDFYLAPEWRNGGGSAGWVVRPGLAFGLVPRTQVEVDVPVVLRRGTSGSPALSGVRVAAQHNLNVERRAMPAIGLEAALRIPAGDVVNAHPSFKGMATKAFRWGRVNAMSETTFGDEPATSAARTELTRWESGVSVDRTLVRRAALIGAELVARQPLERDDAMQWRGALGTAYQLASWTTVGAAIGYAFAGTEQGWHVSAVVTRRLAVPSMLPGTGRWGRR